MAISSITSLSSGNVGANAAASVATPSENGKKDLLASLFQGGSASAKTQLSALGRTKLSLEDLQAAAEAARLVSTRPNLSDFKVAVQGVVQSLNALNAAVRQYAEQGPAKPNPPPEPRAEEAVKQVSQALEEKGAAASLQRLGISQDDQGSFTLNQRQLEAAFREDSQGSAAALDEVASRVEEGVRRGQVAASETTTSAPAATPATSSEETPAAEQERTRAAQRESFRELLAAQLANTRSYVARNAVATYFSVAAL